MDSVDALPGVVRTPSGLRYQIVALADGDIPEEDDTHPAQRAADL
jgi:hypothetical protein